MGMLLVHHLLIIIIERGMMHQVKKASKRNGRVKRERMVPSPLLMNGCVNIKIVSLLLSHSKYLSFAAAIHQIFHVL